mmetsp:Transcript_19861/g.42882  ORF Transcript_19861/g.42882 Transcript_19861/m.42882 type:complete len:151 (-) Transcript_19861:342-794(-)
MRQNLNPAQQLCSLPLRSSSVRCLHSTRFTEATILEQRVACLCRALSRTPLTSAAHSASRAQIKFEFELVCKHRSYRLRAPSAQALAIWVTTISAEWMQLQHWQTQQATGSQMLHNISGETRRSAVPPSPSAMLSPKLPPQQSQSSLLAT